MTSTAFTKAAAPAAPLPLPPPAADAAQGQPVPCNSVLGLYGFVLIRSLISRYFRYFSDFQDSTQCCRVGSANLKG